MSAPTIVYVTGDKPCYKANDNHIYMYEGDLKRFFYEISPKLDYQIRKFDIQCIENYVTCSMRGKSRSADYWYGYKQVLLTLLRDGLKEKAEFIEWKYI